jgi:hypothetical protein
MDNTKPETSSEVMADSAPIDPADVLANLLLLTGEVMIGLSMGILERLRKDAANPPPAVADYGEGPSAVNAFVDALAGYPPNMSGGNKGENPELKKAEEGEREMSSPSGTEQIERQNMLDGNLIRKSADTVKDIMSASTTMAAKLADKAFAGAKDTLEQITGLSGESWAQAMPTITATMSVLAVMIKRMADDPNAREALQALAAAMGETGMEIVRVVQPEVIRVTQKIGESAGTVGGIAARRAAMAITSVFKAGISMIPGLNVVAFGIMTIMSIITGMLRITLQAVGTGEQTTSAFMSAFSSMGQVLEKGSKSVAEATDTLLTVAKPPTPAQIKEDKTEEAKDASLVVDPATTINKNTSGGGKSRKKKNTSKKAKTIKKRIRTSIDRFLKSQVN